MARRPQFLSEEGEGWSGLSEWTFELQAHRMAGAFAGHAGSREDQKKVSALVRLLHFRPGQGLRCKFRCKGDARPSQACFQLLLESSRALVMQLQVEDRDRQDLPAAPTAVERSHVAVWRLSGDHRRSRGRTQRGWGHPLRWQAAPLATSPAHRLIGCHPRPPQTPQNDTSLRHSALACNSSSDRMGMTLDSPHHTCTSSQ
jgi:hypothetical protein